METTPIRKLPDVASPKTVRKYLTRKDANVESLGIVALSKALKWYFLYVGLVLLGLWLYALHPNIIRVLLTLNTYLVVGLLALNYGLVLISYFTSSWPRSNAGIEQKQQLRADGDVVLGYIERILTAIHIILFMVFFPNIFKLPERDKILYYAIFQAPRLISFCAGFPRSHVLVQALVFINRSICLMCEFLTIAVIMYISFIHGTAWIITCALLGGVPMLVFYALYIRGLALDKLFDSGTKQTYMLCGEVQRRWVLFAIFNICAIQWGAAIFLTYFFFPRLSDYGTRKPSAEHFSILSSGVFLAIFTIASLYYSSLKKEVEPIAKSKFRIYGNAKKFLGLEEYSEILDKIQERTDEQNDIRRRYMQHVSLVIACNMSQNNIPTTLEAAIAAGFLRENIFIAHNGTKKEPMDGTGKCTWSGFPTISFSDNGVIMHEIVSNVDVTVQFRSVSDFKGVRYCYIPMGNKTIALHYVIRNYVTSPLVMIIDDDVMIPKNVDMEGACNALNDDDKMKAIAFTIRGIDRPNIWQSFQHLEYMQAGFVKIFQADFGSVLACHGAIALWKTDTISAVLLEHNSEFHGEDLQMGLILRKMSRGNQLGGGNTIGVNAIEPVPTTAPKSLLYERVKGEKSLLVQRVFSWDMAAHHFTLDFLEALVLDWDRKSLILKPFLFLELWTQVQDWLRILFVVTMVSSMPFEKVIYAFLVLLGIQLVLVFAFDRIVIAHRPLLQISGYLLLLYPVYNVISLFFRFGGLLFNVFYYTPWNPPRIKIRERQERKELPPKVEIDDILDSDKEEYWNTIWKNPEEAYKLLTKTPGSSKRDKKGKQRERIRFKGDDRPLDRPILHIP